MSNRPFQSLPPGYGALSTMRPSRRRGRWAPLVLLLLVAVAALVVASAWMVRA